MLWKMLGRNTRSEQHVYILDGDLPLLVYFEDRNVRAGII